MKRIRYTAFLLLAALLLSSCGTAPVDTNETTSAEVTESTEDVGVTETETGEEADDTDAKNKRYFA